MTAHPKTMPSPNHSAGQSLAAMPCSALRVIAITHREAKPWIMEKHYAKRMPVLKHCFGLFNGADCRGVCAYGSGANVSNNTLGRFPMIVAEGMPKNASSWFVSQSLSMLEKPCAVISYADSDFGHVGYIYQATNWIYTGESEGKRVYLKDGKEYHRKTVYGMLGKHDIADAERAGFEYHKGKPKHRYFMFLGSKKEKKEMAGLLPFDVLPYPKGETKRYDALQTITTQGMLL
jgi:hypothetical protein